MKQIYACSVMVIHKPNVFISPGVLVAGTQEEAISRFMDKAVSKWPQELGYIEHSVSCTPLSTDLLQIWIDLIGEENKNEDL